MKYFFLIFSIMVILASGGCSVSNEYSDKNLGNYSEAFYLQLMEGENYEAARNRLLDNDWLPMPAKCSEQNICFKHPEMATNISSNRSCGVFSKNDRLIEICITPILDGLLIKSFEFKTREPGSE